MFSRTELLNRRHLLATLCVAAGAVSTPSIAQNRARRARSEPAPETYYAERADAMRFADDMAARRGLPADWVRGMIGHRRQRERPNGGGNRRTANASGDERHRVARG